MVRGEEDAKRSFRKGNVHFILFEHLSLSTHIGRLVLLVVLLRVKDYIAAGLDKDLVDPDDGANIAKKQARAASTTSTTTHFNLSPLVPKPPSDGWTSCLKDLPAVSFAAIYQHYVERPVLSVVAGGDGQLADDEADGQKSNTVRGISKGFRFFMDGHAQKLEYHDLPEHDGLCYVRASVLPSMVTNKVYTVRICLTADAEVRAAYCMCVAGLAGCCNHVAATLYALEDFVRKV